MLQSNAPVFLTPNGYGTMVLMSIEQYDALSANVDHLLIEADEHAKADPRRYTDDDVFGGAKERIGGYRQL